MRSHFFRIIGSVSNASFFFFFVVAAVAIAFPQLAFAQTPPATGQLPYEAGLVTFRDSMTGPVPFIISLIGIVGCGAMLIFGGEISSFMRTMVFIILVVAVIVQAGSVVKMLGGDWSKEYTLIEAYSDTTSSIA